MGKRGNVNGPEDALDYHRLTVHDPAGLPPADPRLVVGYRPLQWERKPPQFKTYPGHDVVPLPEELPTASSLPLEVGGLARLLFFSAGVVRVAEVGGQPMWFRSAGSAGNLSPVEVYVLCGDLGGLAAGLYHYEPVAHGLVRLRAVPAETPPSLILTGVPWRTAWKYRERGFRHLYWDAGTMLAQALVLAETGGLSARVELGFVDHEVAALVGADGVHEVPLAVVPLGGESSLPPPEPVPSGHLADAPLEFPLITATQRASALQTQDDVESWRRAAVAFPATPATPSAPPLRHSPEDVVRRRGSTRVFDPRRLGRRELLTDAMAGATRPVPADFVSPEGTLLEHDLAVHAVDGVEPGAYRWEQGRLRQLRSGSVRNAARHLCLDQPLGGDGCYTAFHCAHLEAVLAATGSRGYRAVHLEAGVVEGRLHLAAFDQGFGATGLTFYDHEVSRFFGTEAAPVLVTAVGAPAYRSRPGGYPRRPTALRR